MSLGHKINMEMIDRVTKCTGVEFDYLEKGYLMGEIERNQVTTYNAIGGVLDTVKMLLDDRKVFCIDELGLPHGCDIYGDLDRYLCRVNDLNERLEKYGGFITNGYSYLRHTPNQIRMKMSLQTIEDRYYVANIEDKKNITPVEAAKILKQYCQGYHYSCAGCELRETDENGNRGLCSIKGLPENWEV
ncbi:MAG: hypothetical protein LBT06_10700 [Hungatella sp.]|jgi:hypothetical protein|nr:hypothetical protein [Hungatella sp.]